MIKARYFIPTGCTKYLQKNFESQKNGQEITISEFEVDTDEWNKICREGFGVRVLEGGKISSAEL